MHGVAQPINRPQNVVSVRMPQYLLWVDVENTRTREQERSKCNRSSAPENVFYPSEKSVRSCHRTVRRHWQAFMVPARAPAPSPTRPFRVAKQNSSVPSMFAEHFKKMSPTIKKSHNTKIRLSPLSVVDACSARKPKPFLWEVVSRKTLHAKS